MEGERMKGSHRVHLKDHCEACERVLGAGGLTIHHISSRADNGSKNLQTLCYVCHSFWHNINSKVKRGPKRNPSGRMPKLFKGE